MMSQKTVGIDAARISAERSIGIDFELSIMPNNECMPLYQRRRASITGFGLWLQEII